MFPVNYITTNLIDGIIFKDWSGGGGSSSLDSNISRQRNVFRSVDQDTQWNTNNLRLIIINLFLVNLLSVLSWCPVASYGNVVSISTRLIVNIRLFRMQVNVSCRQRSSPGTLLDWTPDKCQDGVTFFPLLLVRMRISGRLKEVEWYLTLGLCSNYSVPGHVGLIIVLEYHLVSWIVLILCIEFKKMLIYDIVLLSLNVKYFF